MKKVKSILILDMGSGFIKLIEVDSKGPRPFTKNFSVTPVPHELREIEAVNNPSYVGFIKKIISQKGITAKDTIICISHPQLEVKNLVLPLMTPKELKTSIEWQIKDALSIPIGEAVVGYTILGDIQTPEGKKMELCIAAVPKKLSEEYVSLLESLGLVPCAFLIEPLCAWHAIVDIPEFKDKETVAVVDIGAETTFISVFENSRFRLMRSLPCSGNRFTSGIASRVETTEGQAVDIEMAEALKCKYGIPSGTGITEEKVNLQDIFSALRPSLEDLTNELMRFLEYYKSEHADKGVGVIAICGGGSRMQGLSDYISKNIGIPVISPVLQKEKFGDQDVFLVNVIGASLIRDRGINLVSPEVREGQKLIRERAIWIKARAGLAVILSVLYMFLLVVKGQRQRGLVRLKDSYEKLSSWKTELDRYSELVYELNRKNRLCNELLRREPFWEDLFKELGSLVPGNIIINEFGFGRGEEGSSRVKLPLSIAGVVYKGDTLPEQVLTLFMQNLEKSRYFYKVKLEFSKEIKSEDGGVLEFKIGCDIR